MTSFQRIEIRQWTGRTLAAAIVMGGLLVSIGAGPNAGAAPLPTIDPTTLVNPFIGTSGGGNTYPGAAVPFGMVQWSPDTPNESNGSSYDYDSPSIVGYGLTQLSGAGCPSEGDVPILPTVGAVGADPAQATEPLVHTDEAASPGYYELDAGGVTTRLTATTRTGLATFSFPHGSSEGNLLFKLSASQGPVSSSHFHVVSNREVEGWVTTGDFCGGTNTYTLHFDMVFNHAMASSGAWTTGGNGAYVTFNTASSPVIEAKVGISYVSTANATLNLSTEDPGWNFRSVEAAAQNSWRTMLSSVKVAGGTPAQETIFYTSLYHSLLEPNVFSDVNGEYLGLDGQVHRVAGAQREQYTNFSGWDVYRSEVQLQALLAPGRMSDIVTSMLNDYAETGEFPKWEENDGEAYIMVGDSADGIIADAYAYGATKFNTGQALADMKAEATLPNNVRPGLNYYETDGFLPIDGTYGCCNFNAPVSAQEEYDTDDDAIAQFATELGEKHVAATFATRAQNWQNVFNPGSGYLQPKEGIGMFQPGFSPTSQNGFAEAGSSIYTAMIPFDVAGLIAAEGGDAAWVDYLNGLTSNVTAEGADQIQMGDEPSFDIPWEYDYAGAPAKTQQVVREILDDDFADSPEGLPGNDDLGAMSSWYVWAALGAYPETPGSSDLVLGSPLFSTVSIRLADGKAITESTTGQASTAPYVQHLSMDGRPWQRSYVPVDTLTKGATLQWHLAATPSAWASASDDAPPSNEQGLLPALGYLTDTEDSGATVTPGGTSTLTLGVQSMSTATQQIRWAASIPPGSGIEVVPQSGTIAVPPEAKATAPMEITAPSSAAAGQYTVTIALHTAAGAALPAVVTTVDVG